MIAKTLFMANDPYLIGVSILRDLATAPDPARITARNE